MTGAVSLTCWTCCRKEKRRAALADLVDQLSVPEDTSSVKVWTFLLNGKPNSVVFRESIFVNFRGRVDTAVVVVAPVII